MADEQVFFGEDGPQMRRANQRARETFRFLWRELTWEYRRIVPALDLAAAKFAFSDPGKTEVEQMWVGQLAFDGRQLTGELMNSPNALSSVSEGSRITRPLGELNDWMYVLNGVAYGAFTVNVIRAGMSVAEREQHDAAWGLDFGDPNGERLFPDQAADGHPMEEHMTSGFREHLTSRPDDLHVTDPDGLSPLHSMALGGAVPCVSLLLELGADRDARTRHGDTALDLARALGWTEVVALFH